VPITSPIALFSSIDVFERDISVGAWFLPPGILGTPYKEETKKIKKNIGTSLLKDFITDS
jgi:hypothetical protein